MANDKKKKGIPALNQKLKRWVAGRPFLRKKEQQASKQDTAPRPPRHSRRLGWATDRVIGLHNKIWSKKKEDTVAVCGCGRPLDAGWECPNCRFECPTCHRGLGEGEQCSRCHPQEA